MRKPFTNIRKEILDILNKSTNPLSAGEIDELYGKKVDLSTIYRALKYLESQQLIEGFSIQCSTEENMRYYYATNDRHIHFIHCENCHQFIRLDECFIENYVHSIEEKYHYRILHHSLYFTGICEKCRQSQLSSP